MRPLNTFIRSSAPSFVLLIIFLIIASQIYPVPRMYMPMPDFRPIPVAIASTVCDPPAPFLALVLVLSHPANVGKRSAVRTTYPDQEIAPLGYRRLFVLGTYRGGENDWKYSNANITDSAIEAESAEHGDIMQLAHTELYDDLILKAYGAFAWAIAHCGQARFIVKNDDDMFFDYYLMERALRQVPDFEVDNTIFGNLIEDTWNLTPYMAGGSYLLSPKTLEILVDAVTRVEPPIQPYIHFAEDVYFTGMVADRVGVVRSDMEMVRSWQGTPNCCVSDAGQFFECEFSVFMQKPLQLSLELLFRFKEHGKMCYKVHCKKFLTSLLSRTDVKCFRS